VFTVLLSKWHQRRTGHNRIFGKTITALGDQKGKKEKPGPGGSQRSEGQRFKASSVKKFIRPLSQPVKPGHGGMHLSFQLWGSVNRRTVVQGIQGKIQDPIPKIKA
jgi:hypothetical protein